MKKYINKLAEIYEGWKNDAFPTPEIIELAEKRADKCAGCPLNINNQCNGGTEGEAVVDFVYQGKQRTKGTKYKGCNCPISKKTKSPNSKCPLGKWEDVK